MTTIGNGILHTPALSNSIPEEKILSVCKKYSIDLSKVLYLHDITTAKARRLAQEISVVIIDPTKNSDACEVDRKIASIRPSYIFFTEMTEDSLIPVDYRAVEMECSPVKDSSEEANSAETSSPEGSPAEASSPERIKGYQFNDRFQKTFRALESLSEKVNKIPNWFVQDFFDNKIVSPIFHIGKERLKKLNGTDKIEAMLAKLKRGETRTFQIENLFKGEKIATIEVIRAAIEELGGISVNSQEERQAVEFLKNQLIKKFPALKDSLQSQKSFKQILKTIAIFIIKMPALVVVNNLMTLLLPVLAPILLIAHPLESLVGLLKVMVRIAKTISSTPTAWTKIGSGMIGFAVGEMLIHPGLMEAVFMLLGILLTLVGIIGSMVMRAEESAEDGKGAFKGSMEGLLDQLSVIPVSFASAFNLGLFIGFIQGLSPDFIIKHFKIPKVNTIQPISSHHS